VFLRYKDDTFFVYVEVPYMQGWGACLRNRKSEWKEVPAEDQGKVGVGLLGSDFKTLRPELKGFFLQHPHLTIVLLSA